MPYNLITILGPTATGKTGLAARLAREFNGEIISADSRQVYRGMDIGTGKDYDDYTVDGININYHLIDIISPAEEFNLYGFKEYFNDAYNNIISRGKIPFLTGGTGLYLSSILQNYNLEKAEFDGKEISRLNMLETEELRRMLLNLNPALHNTTDLLDKERIIRAIIVNNHNRQEKDSINSINSFNIGINLPRAIIKERITARLKKRLASGMIEEVQSLLKSISYEKLLFFGLEYKFIAKYIKGELNYNDMYQKLNSAIHAFAKRQMTWFRKMEKEGVIINWIEGADFESAYKLIKEHLNEFATGS